MEPVTITVTTYVAMKMVDQFISQEGYGWFRKLFINEKNYSDKLYQIIEEAASEYESVYPLAPNSEKIPFYQSRPLFELLNQHILFHQLPTHNSLLDEFKKYPKVIPPTSSELENFYHRFCTKINNCSELKKLNIAENYKEKIFEIGDSLFELKLLLETIDKKITFTLNQEWLNKKSNEAIADLGNRYTPELNLKLGIAKIFEGIGRTEKFSEIVYERFDKLLIKANKLRNDDIINESFNVISSNAQAIAELYKECEFIGNRQVPFEDFVRLIRTCSGAVNAAEDILWKEKEKLQQEKKQKEFSDKYATLHRELREFGNECTKIEGFLDSTTVKLANNPFLLLEGDAGIGKSHLLADIVKTRVSAGSASLFILGQHLTVNESPWSQIFKGLQLNITSDELLEKLNLYGKRAGKRVIVFIDAINEGDGNKFWPDHINSFVDSIKGYEWLGLVMSIRTTYKNITISSDQVARNNLEQYRHFGFKSVELNAINLFFDNYNIERPSAPFLNPEFKNPLFLKLFCEGIKKSNLNYVPSGLEGITSILEFFIEGVNKTLSSKKHHNYNSSFKLVRNTITALIRTKVDLGNKTIPIDAAFHTVQSVVKEYVQNKTFLDDLINEGVLTKGIIREDDNVIDVVYITFERFDDHLTANFLLEGVVNVQDEFSIGGKLYDYVKNTYALYSHQGIIEALSIQVPEKFGKELYELVPKLQSDHEFILAFINSLIWRAPESINLDKIKSYLEQEVFSYEGTHDHFMETLISLTSIENHPFNANFLHNMLIKLPLPKRDAYWTTFLKYKYSKESTFRQLIDWAWSDNDKSHISTHSLELIGTTLFWFLTSSNRELRDSTTKALVNLLKRRMDVLISLMKKFETIDDPYIMDRVYAVSLGCTLTTKETGSLKELSEIVYASIFDKDQVYPHVLLRDYAREIIEYINHLGIVSDKIDIQKTLPPYGSSWPAKAKIPTRDKLEKLYSGDEHYHLWASIMGGGDFSRYTIGTNSNHSDWSGCKFGEVPANRKKIYKDFKKSLTIDQLKLFDGLDPIITGYSGKIAITVGRKSEEELNINKTTFKTSLSEDELKLYETDVEPYLNHNHDLIDTDNYFDLRLAERFIFNRVIELGWLPELHYYFDKRIGTGRGRNESHQERIGKKYQWIAYYEFMARLADNFIRYDGYGDERKENPYVGPWVPYVRDIDPTILLKSTGYKVFEKSDYWWSCRESFDWNCSFEEWISNNRTLENPYGLIEVKDDKGKDWLVLESCPTWNEPKMIGHENWGHPRKEVWCQVRSYLVQDTEYNKLKKWLGEQHFMGCWMPESNERYQLFNREYYWSQAFSCFQSDYYCGSDWVDIQDEKTDNYIAKVSVNSQRYRWEEEFDRSKSETLSFLKPSSLLFEKMNLRPGDEEGSFVDEEGKIICFAAEALNDTKAHLLIRKQEFLTMLEENSLKVVWTLRGEKGVIGGSHASSHNYGRTEFSGAFYLDNGKVNGSHKIY
jgi:PHP family Zn ribbon phosphoesterase